MSESKRGALLAVIVLLGVFIFSGFATIASVERVPLCFFHYLTHLDCPGCGLVRSFISISHGHFLQAVRFNALGPLIYLFFLFYLVKNLFILCGSSKILRLAIPAHRSAVILFAILFWGQWALKIGKHFI